MAHVGQEARFLHISLPRLFGRLLHVHATYGGQVAALQQQHAGDARGHGQHRAANAGEGQLLKLLAQLPFPPRVKVPLMPHTLVDHAQHLRHDLVATQHVAPHLRHGRIAFSGIRQSLQRLQALHHHRGQLLQAFLLGGAVPREFLQGVQQPGGLAVHVIQDDGEGLPTCQRKRCCGRLRL